MECSLIIYGVTKLSGYFAKDLFQLAFQFDLALGIVSIVLGIIIIKKTEYIIEILSTAIDFYVGRWSASRYRLQWKQNALASRTGGSYL